MSELWLFDAFAVSGCCVIYCKKLWYDFSMCVCKQTACVCQPQDGSTFVLCDSFDSHNEGYKDELKNKFGYSMLDDVNESEFPMWQKRLFNPFLVTTSLHGQPPKQAAIVITMF